MSEEKRVRRSEVIELIKRQEFRCRYTGRELTPETAQLDHVVPLKSGGSHSMENLQVVHASVNSMKGTLSESEFLAACLEVVKHMKLGREP